VAVITGASSGIGRAAAILFAEEKAKVVAAARRIDAIEETVAIIKAKGNEAIAVQADVTKAADVRNIFTKTIEVYGQLDILFNNAGMEQPYKLIMNRRKRLGRGDGYQYKGFTSRSMAFLTCSIRGV
jgi:NAD(P)-dependent dehydrogenase (short-subunit alcohol dehydrogenase family)